MNNNIENNVPVNNSMPAKGNSKMIVAILVIAVVALAAYLVYDKVIKKEENTDSKDSGEVLSDEEALKIGNELFEYTYTLAFFDSDLCKYSTADGKYPTDMDPVDLGDDGEGYEITNYDEIMGHFSKECKKVYWDYEDSDADEEEQTCDGNLGLVTKNGKHYAIDMYRGSNTSLINIGDLRIKNKEQTKIEFSVDYIYCTGDTETEDIASENSRCYVQDENGSTTDKLVDPTTYTKDFIIVKEDGSWKIQKYYNDNA